MSEILSILKSEGYRWGNCQVLRYDPNRPDVFPEGYVTKLYQLCKGNEGQTSARHFNILPSLFCGMTHLDHDAITTYLIQRPILLPVIWQDQNTFVEAGIGFPVLFQPPFGIKADERAAFVGYGFFRPFWGISEIEILTMLGLAYIFTEFSLLAIHGIRYATNGLTARLTSRFGFKETGRVPRYQTQNGVLVPGVVSSLMIEDFEKYVEQKLLELA